MCLLRACCGMQDFCYGNVYSRFDFKFSRVNFFSFPLGKIDHVLTPDSQTFHFSTSVEVYSFFCSTIVYRFYSLNNFSVVAVFFNGNLDLALPLTLALALTKYAIQE